MTRVNSLGIKKTFKKTMEVRILANENYERRVGKFKDVKRLQIRKDNKTWKEFKVKARQIRGIAKEMNKGNG